MQDDDDKPEVREAASEEAGPQEAEVREDEAAETKDGDSKAEEAKVEESKEAVSEEEAEESGAAAPDDGTPPEPEPEAAEEAKPEEVVEESVSAEEAADVELAAIEFLESQMDALKAELDAKAQALAQAEAMAKKAVEARARLQADFDNFRKRQEREIVRLQDEKLEKVLLKILPVYDTFGRAIDQYEKDNSEDALYDGLQRIEKMFLQLLESMDITVMEAAGKPFDPNIHDAVCRTAIPEGGFDDMVVDVFETGYLLGEKVLKPAKVSVAKEE